MQQQNQQGGQQNRQPGQPGQMPHNPVQSNPVQSMPTQPEAKKALSWEPTKGAAQSVPAPVRTPVAAAPQPPKASRTSATVAAVVILVALGAWGVSALREHGTTSQGQKTETGTEANTTAISNETKSAASSESTLLSVPPQQAGETVSVEGLSVTEPTWVVVYDSLDGKAGNTLGAELVFPGQSTADVSLMRATESGKSYVVGESTATGGSHTYSRDLPQLAGWATFTAE